MEPPGESKKIKLSLQETRETAMDNQQNKADDGLQNVDSSETETVVPFEAMEASGFGCLSTPEVDVNLNTEELQQCHPTGASQRLNSFLLKSLHLPAEPNLKEYPEPSHEPLIHGSDNTAMLFDWETDVSQVEVETEPQESFTNHSVLNDMSWHDAQSEIPQSYLENKVSTTVKIEAEPNSCIGESHHQSKKPEMISHRGGEVNVKERLDRGNAMCTTTNEARRIVQKGPRAVSHDNNREKRHNRRSESKLKKRKRVVIQEGRDVSSAKSEKHLENRLPGGRRNIGVQSSLRTFIHRAPPARGYCGRCILRARLLRHNVGLQCNLDDDRKQKGARANGLEAVVASEGGGASPRVRMRFPALVRASHDTRGGASVVVASHADTRRLTRADGVAFAKDFYRALLWEGNNGAVHAAGVVLGGACGAPLRVLAETMPRLRVHTSPLQPQLPPSGDADAELPIATTVGDYFQNVRENILPGEVLRCGPLLPLSLSGGGSQCGACDGGSEGRAAALESLAEHSPFVKVALPGGQLNPNQHATLAAHRRTQRSKRPRGRDALLPSPAQGDGPWLWVRPGEQLLPPSTGTGASLPNESHLKRARDRTANVHQQAHDDEDTCEAGVVVGSEGEETEDEEELRRTGGWIEVVERWGPRSDSSAVAFAFLAADGSESTAAAVEAVAFAPDDLPILRSVKALANDSDADWGLWAGSARLNYLRSRGVRWASLSLRHGDLLVIPRRAAVQLHIPTATQGVSWRIRPRDYCRAPWRL